MGIGAIVGGLAALRQSLPFKRNCRRPERTKCTTQTHPAPELGVSALSNKVKYAAAIGLALIGLAAVPAAMLDLVRWGAIVAIALFAGWQVVRRREPNREAAEVVATHSAVLMVSVAAARGRAFDVQERKQFKSAIMRCVRTGDHVAEIDPEHFAISLSQVAPQQAEAIAQRISEQLQDVIIFGESGAIEHVKVGVGGVAPFTGRAEDGHKIARENLGKLDHMSGVNVLMSRAA